MLTLPRDVYSQLLCFLDPKDVLTLSASCRRLHILSDDSLWRFIFLFHFAEEKELEGNYKRETIERFRLLDVSTAISQGEVSDYAAFYAALLRCSRSLLRRGGRTRSFLERIVGHVANKQEAASALTLLCAQGCMLGTSSYTSATLYQWARTNVMPSTGAQQDLAVVGACASFLTTWVLMQVWDTPIYGFEVESPPKFSDLLDREIQLRGYYLYGEDYTTKDDQMQMRITFGADGTIFGEGHDMVGPYDCSGKWKVALSTVAPESFQLEVVHISMMKEYPGPTGPKWCYRGSFDGFSFNGIWGDENWGGLFKLWPFTENPLYGQILACVHPFDRAGLTNFISQLNGTLFERINTSVGFDAYSWLLSENPGFCANVAKLHAKDPPTPTILGVFHHPHPTAHAIKQLSVPADCTHVAPLLRLVVDRMDLLELAWPFLKVASTEQLLTLACKISARLLLSVLCRLPEERQRATVDAPLACMALALVREEAAEEAAEVVERLLAFDVMANTLPLPMFLQQLPSGITARHMLRVWGPAWGPQHARVLQIVDQALSRINQLPPN